MRERCAETRINDIPCSNVKVLHRPKDAPLEFSAINPSRATKSQPQPTAPICGCMAARPTSIRAGRYRCATLLDIKLPSSDDHDPPSETARTDGGVSYINVSRKGSWYSET